MQRVFIIFICTILLAFAFWPEGEERYGPGIIAPDEPLQTNTFELPFAFNDFTVEPVADFKLRARVLSREDYSFGREADLSPIDLALGWREMSDETVLDQIDISQGGRFYRWRVEDWPVPRRTIETNSANMHLIPANDFVLDAMERTRRGSLVEFEGHLVDVFDSNGWRWNSSTTRNDTGAGACELIYVTSFRIVPSP